MEKKTITYWMITSTAFNNTLLSGMKDLHGFADFRDLLYLPINAIPWNKVVYIVSSNPVLMSLNDIRR